MSVEAKIQRMIQFMEEDTNQRIAEIEKKAKEQASLLSQQLSIEHTKKVEQEFEKQMKEVKQELQVQQSDVLNKARLDVLQVCDQMKDECLEQCRAQIKSCSNYQQVLEKLIVQGAELLKQKKIVVVCCKGDEDVCKKAISALKGYEITLSDKRLDKTEFLGGVDVMTADQKITVENTFEKRLQLAYKKMAPGVSAILFQENSSLW